MAPNGYLDGYTNWNQEGNKIKYADAIEYYDTYHHQPQRKLNGLQSSSSRLYFPFAWLYRHTGDKVYIDILNKNYDSITKGRPSWNTKSPWMQTYLVERFLRPKKDQSPPHQITDLRVIKMKRRGEVRLEWTAPVDNTAVKKYQIKYAELPMVEQIKFPDEVGVKTNFWASTNIAGEPDPFSPRSKQSVIINGLDPSKKYYFAIRSYDTSNNRSKISNQPFLSPLKKSP